MTDTERQFLDTLRHVGVHDHHMKKVIENPGLAKDLFLVIVCGNAEDAAESRMRDPTGEKSFAESYFGD